MHFPPKFLQKRFPPPYFFHGAFAPSFIWSRRPWIGTCCIELPFHPCNILSDTRRRVSRGNKNVGCGTWKRRFFALAVRITGKLLRIDGYNTISNCVFNFNILALVVSEILGDPKFTLGGPVPLCTPHNGKIFVLEASTLLCLMAFSISTF